MNITKTKKKKGTYGIYGIRKNKNKFEVRTRKTIDNVTKDFTGRGITEAFAIQDLETKIEKFITDDIYNEKNITVENWCKCWLKEKIMLRSYSYYECLVRRYIVPVLGKKKLTDLKLKDLQDVINKMAIGELSEGTRKKHITKKQLEDYKKGLSKATMTKVKNTMSQIFQYAIDNKYMEQIPFRNLKIPNVKEKEKIFLTLEQENSLVSYLLNDNSTDCGLMLLLQDFRGLRASEVCGLKWENIDFKNRKIYIRQGIQNLKQFDRSGKPTGEYKLQETSLKTKASKRDIEMNDILYFKLKNKFNNYIKTCFKNGTSQNSEDFIFKTTRNTLYDCKALEKDLYRILKKLNLPKIGTHQLRHLFCTRLAENGIHPRVAQELMGHSDVSTTLKIYTSVRNEQKIDAIKKIDENRIFSPITL